MANYTEIIGKKIKEFRVELGDTQAEFAEKLGVNRSSLSLMEKGSQAPDLETFANFLVMSGKDAHELLEINKKNRIIVDTNIILKRPNIVNELIQHCDFVYIPKPVVDELNHIKDNGIPSKKKLASLCMTKITGLISENFIVGGNVDNSKTANNDDKILRYATDIAAENKSDTVYLYSNDKDFKLKDCGNVKNFRIIESKDFDLIFKSTMYNIPRSQRFFDLVNRVDMKALRDFDLTGVDINYIDMSTGYTPLIQTIRKPHIEPEKQLELIRFLLNLPGIDINRVDNKKYRFPPLSHAIQIHRLDLIGLLLDNGANVNEPSENDKNPYNTPLMIAAWGGNLKEVNLLMENGACINQQDKGNGFTALIKAAFQNKPAVVEYLLEKGADTSICSFERKTALDYAYEKNYKSIIKILKRC